ncbi:MAG: collagen-binding domain-containing protein [Sphingomonadaceae bacterium]
MRTTFLSGVLATSFMFAPAAFATGDASAGLQAMKERNVITFANGPQAGQTSLIENLTALSAALGKLDTTPGSSINYANRNNVRVTAVAGTDGFAVINTDAASFFNAAGMSFQFTPGTTTVINISGAGDFDWKFNTLGNSRGHNPYVIYNFTGATDLDLRTMVHGSVLAPYAHVTNHNRIEGSLVANRFTPRGAANLGNFTGDIGFKTSPVFDAAPGVPEPATWAMLISGFGLVGLTMRRRRRGLVTVNA